MKILSIESSCDETAVSIVDASGGMTDPVFDVLANNLLTQMDLHAEYGGVYPTLAKREHAKNIIPLVEKSLNEASSWSTHTSIIEEDDLARSREILKREPELLERIIALVENNNRPDIDVIGVTVGPGLEPALWIGVNTAEVLGILWNIPVVPINHMEGHILSVLLPNSGPAPKITFPALSLLISGGHTDLIKMDTFLQYTYLGRTRDDAVGEAFDKIARLIGLPYPGGRAISELAAQSRERGVTEERWNLPRPMINSENFDFSFAGLKTAARYAVEKHGEFNEEEKQDFAREVEDAITETLLKKVGRALEETGAHSLVIGGGVIANKHLREKFGELVKKYDAELFIPEHHLATDNSLMIAITTYLRITNDPEILSRDITLTANGNLTL
jgi:N6-L-threonylcarbamoyladenine synthase